MKFRTKDVAQTMSNMIVYKDQTSNEKRIMIGMNCTNILTPANEDLGQGDVFTPVCDSVHRGQTPPWQTPPGRHPPADTLPACITGHMARRVRIEGGLLLGGLHPGGGGY